MHTLPVLKPGDSVEIIAPASRCTDAHLAAIKALLASWQLNCIVEETIFGDDLLCANDDEKRFSSLQRALQRPETKAVICARGGYGSMRLIPALTQIKPSASPKLFIGMSDITALNLYLQQQWQWPTIHGALAVDIFSPESIAAMKSVLFGEMPEFTLQGVPLNKSAKNHRVIESVVTGGNLCLVQASIGTPWQLNGKNKIIFLEETNERGYRIDRMLEHLRQANLFKAAEAILLGDFIKGDEPDGSSLVLPVLERFAAHCDIPVVQVQGIGHGRTSMPVILGQKTFLTLGEQCKLTFPR